MASINDVIKQIDEQEEREYQAFVVTDMETAAEAQRRLTYFEEKKAEIDGIIEQQIKPFIDKIEKIKQWGNEAKQEYADKQEHYSNLLEAYWRQEVAQAIEAGKKPRKTLKLPYGSITLKKQQPKFHRDEDMLFKFAKDSGYVRIKESTDWSKLKKECQVVGGQLVTENGEIVPGVEVEEREDKFEIKLDY